MSENQNEFKATVMPQEKKTQQSQGLPGLQIPDNIADIKEFQNISKVDAKELNAQITAEALKKKDEIAAALNKK